MYFLIKTGSWVAAGGPAAEQASEYAHAVEIVNLSFYYALLVGAIFSAVMLVLKVMRLIRGPRSRADTPSVGAPAKQGD